MSTTTSKQHLHPKEIINDLENPLKPTKIREEYIEVEPNVRLHVTDAGEGDVIVLLHGWPLGDEMYEYQYEALVKNNYRVIGITFRGFSKSDKPFGKYDYDVHVKDVKTILSKLEISDAFLGGFSMGGAIAIRFVSTYPNEHICKLGLFGAAAPIWTQRADYPINLTTGEVDQLIELCNTDRTQLLLNVGKIFSASENSLSEGIKNWLYNMGLNASSHAMSQCLIALRDTDLRNELAQIKIPTLVLHGKKDKICSYSMAEEMHAALSNSTLVAFEESGHSLFLEEIKKFNSELIKLARCEENY